MKNIQDAIEWFNELFDNCYEVKHIDYPESVFMFYDINYVRQLKLAKLEEKKLLKTKITGECIFHLDWKNKRFNYDYTIIDMYLRDNCSIYLANSFSFIQNRLNERPKLSILQPNNAIYTKYLIECQNNNCGYYVI